MVQVRGFRLWASGSLSILQLTLSPIAMLGFWQSSSVMAQSDLAPVQPRRPSTFELLEEARQRLRQRGELSPTGAPVLPTLPVPVPEQPALPTAPPKDPIFLYRLGVGDGIAINVLRFPEFNQQATLDPEGNIRIPLVGTISLDGLTLDEAERKLSQALNRYVIDPIVQVRVVSPRSIQVTVVGEVFEPGFYFLSLRGQLPRVSTALFAAGGTTEWADLRAIKIRRVLIDGSVIEQNLDLFSPLRTGDALPDLGLQDRDAVIVTKLDPTAMKDYDRLLVGRSTLAQPEINVRVLSYASSSLGNIRLRNGSRFADALSSLGPNPEVADINNVALIRFDPTVGKAVTIQLDGGKALRGDALHNIQLQDNDVLVIGRTLVAEITSVLNVFTQPFRDVLGFLLFFRSLSDNANSIFGPGSTTR